MFIDLSYTTSNCNKQSIQTDSTETCLSSQQQLTALNNGLKASSLFLLVNACYSNSKQFSSSPGAYTLNDMCENILSTQTTMLKLQNSFGVVNTVLGQSILVGCSCHIPWSDLGWICVFGQSKNIVNPWHWLSLNPSFCIQPSVIYAKHILSLSLQKKPTHCNRLNNVVNKFHLNQKYMSKAMHDKYLRN